MATATTPPTTAPSPPTTAPATVADLLRQLGEIDPGRVRLVPPLGTATEADLTAINGARQGTCELVDGVLVEKAMGFNESDLALVLATYLVPWILQRNLGRFSGETGAMRLFPGIIRIPDFAFASWDRIPGRRRTGDAIAPFAPDLAVEVLSRGDTKKEMARKRREYFAAGTRLVWEVDPKKRIVAIYTSPDRPTILDATMTLDGGDVLPGFALPLADLFAELDRHG